jgi:hypothetical protein
MAHKIDSPAARAKLAARRAPYFHKVRPQHFLGFRFMTEGAAGTWVAKVEATGGKVLTCSLGRFDEVDDKGRFAAALVKAEAWFTELAAGATEVQVLPSRVTMLQALREYATWCRTTVDTTKDKAERKAEAKASAAEARFKQLVIPFKLADGTAWVDKPLNAITPADYREWRAWAAAVPVKARGKKGGAAARRRTGATMNRDIAQFRAALNMAREHHTGHEGKHVIGQSWKKPLARNLKADESRGEWVYLDEAERAELRAGAAEAAPELVPFVEAMLAAPLRPGAWTSLQVRDYHRKTHSVTVRDDKAGAGRVVALPDDEGTRKLFTDAVAGRIGALPLFCDAEGQQWSGDSWNKAFKRAAKAAGLSKALSMYCLRHTLLTDLITAGAPIGAVAKVAGTSVAIIEKHYLHLQADAVRTMLALRLPPAQREQRLAA